MNLTYSFLDPRIIMATEDFRMVENFLTTTRRRNIGWHYIVDLTYIFSRARHWPAGLKILDAGGGRGPAQFLLAEMGFDVVNIDLMHMVPNYAHIYRYNTSMVTLRSFTKTHYSKHMESQVRYTHILKRIWKAVKESSLLRDTTVKLYAERHDKWRRMSGFDTVPIGKIQWITGNLCDLPEMESNSFTTPQTSLS